MAAAPDTLAHLLLAHFDRHSRDMPWRRTSDPYAIWVSEVMLQQTRVDTVIPYFERWLERFPDVAALADADDAVVLKAWEGLGYYSRARNLKAAATAVRERHNGRVPDSADELKTLPGVGDYTAGAVASIAFGRREPAVDGNARRVFSRLLDLDRPSFKQLQPLVRDFIPEDRPGDFNQAVMELGSTICTPKNPRCDDCPVRGHCRAYANGTVELRPGSSESRAAPAFDVATAVLLATDDARMTRTLLVQRPHTGLLAGMWEFPSMIAPPSRASRMARQMARQITGEPARSRAKGLPPVRHLFSHRTETYHPFVIHVVYTPAVRDSASAGDHGGGSRDIDRSAFGGRAFRWVSAGEMEGLALSVAQRRIAVAAGFVTAATAPA
jgi:A/G-specific adenine glycosylase